MNKRIILILIFIMVFLTGCTSDNPGYMNVYDTNGEPMEFDSNTGAAVTIEYEHYQIHQGNHYYVSGFDTVANGANVTFATTTPNSSTWIHMTFETQATSRYEFYVYEDASITGGMAAAPFNNNRNSSKASVLTTVKNPATVPVLGTLIYSQSSGLEGVPASKGDMQGLHDRSREIILKQNTTYLWVFVSRDNGNIISYIGEWYEHANRVQ